jgi:hypothetical protein
MPLEIIYYPYLADGTWGFYFGGFCSGSEEFALRKVQNFKSKSDNGVRNGAILKWWKILKLVVGFTILKFPFSPG